MTKTIIYQEQRFAKGVPLLLVCSFILCIFFSLWNTSYAAGTWEEYSFSGMKWRESAYNMETKCADYVGSGASCTPGRDTTCIIKPAVSGTCTYGLYGQDVCYMPYAYRCVPPPPAPTPVSCGAGYESESVSPYPAWYDIGDVYTQCQDQSRGSVYVSSQSEYDNMVRIYKVLCGPAYETKCVAQCQSTIPSNASAYGSSESSAVTTPINWAFASSNTSRKCEFSCNAGYEWNASGGRCEKSAEVCTGTLASNATSHGASEETGLSASTPWTHASSNTANKCEFSCNTGYEWNGSSCTPKGCQYSGPVSWGGGSCSATAKDVTFVHDQTKSIDNTAPSYSGSVSYKCVFGRLIKQSGETCVADSAPPVNGVCSVSRDSCVAGSFQDQSDTPTSYQWNCLGLNGGTTAQCSSPIPTTPTNGACGTTANSCSAGNLQDRPDTPTTVEWNCLGLNGGTTASCSASSELGGGGGTTIQGCTNPSAENYDPSATSDDSSCVYSCQPTTLSWQNTYQKVYTLSTVACAAPVASVTAHGGRVSLGNTAYAPLLQGAGTFTCVNGTFVPESGSICFPPTDPVMTITPRIVPTGTQATLHIEPKMNTNCRLQGGIYQNSSIRNILPLSGNTPAVINEQLTVTAKTTYILTCDEGSATSTVEIISKTEET